MNIIQVNDTEEMSSIAAEKMIDCLKEKPHAVFGLATGSTPEGTYRTFIEQVHERKLDITKLTTINLDEYVGLAPSHPMSYHAYMKQHFFTPLGLEPSQTNLPRGDAPDPEEEAQRYEALIQQGGGIDFQLLGIGENGHIAVNEPGTPFQSRTQVVRLTANTREVNSRFFDKKEDVPTHALTMGLATIMEARSIVLLANGERKREAITRCIEGEINEEAPASILRNHPHVTVIADKEALRDISEEKIQKV